MKGIKETEDVLALLSDLAKQIKEAKADGKLDIFDAVSAAKLLPSAVSAIRGADEIKAELVDLTGEEKDILIGKIKQVLFDFVGAFA